MRYVAAYLIALAIFLVLDALWLGLVARGFYMSRIGDLILDQPRWGVAAIFYALYVVGLVYFAVSTGLDPARPAVAALNGALFGFFAYATYDLTNQATLKNWSTMLSLIDISWGAFVTAVSAAVGYLAVAAWVR